jgi:uncharacterized OB-fold protein
MRTTLVNAGWLTEGADGPYWRALEGGGLELPRCASCGRWHWPAVWRCGECGAWEQTWTEVEMIGRIYSWTRTHHPFGGTEGIGVPFVTVVVELPGAGGIRLTGVLEGDTAMVAIGAAVAGAVRETLFDGMAIPTIRWRLKEAGR